MIRHLLVAISVLLFLVVPTHGEVLRIDVSIEGGSGDGTSWQDAYRDLQNALAAAQEGDELWISEGIYLPDEGIGFIRDTVGEGKKPFFLILGHYAVHTPIQAPKKLVANYQAKKKRMYGSTPLKMIPERFKRKVPARQQNPTYAAMIENLDTNVGKVVTALDELGVTENTIIVFTSDNGGSCMPKSRPTSNYPLRASKGWNYEGGIRVPTFITWPGTIPAMKTAEPVITMDLYPTLLELTNCEPMPKQTVDGRSLVPLIHGEEKTLNRPFLAWWYPHKNGHGTQPCQAILQDGCHGAE